MTAASYAELRALESWRARLAAAGYRVLVEPWSPAPPAPGVRRAGRRA